MKAQEVFDTVVRHLAKQGRRAVVADADHGYVCRYHTPDGLKCAVGCLIPDDQYNPAIEGRMFSSLATAAHPPAWVRDIVDSGHQTLLFDLQRAHDTPADGYGLGHHLSDIAAYHGLSAAILNEVTLPEEWK